MTGLSAPFKMLLFPLLCQMDVVFWGEVVGVLERLTTHSEAFASLVAASSVLPSWVFQSTQPLEGEPTISVDAPEGG